MNEWADFFAPAPTLISVVGMAKNTGKTVAQNYLRQLAQAEGRVIGLLSTGLDGEKRDALTQLPKPAVNVNRGTLVATVESTLENPRLWECLGQTGIMTPIGRVYIFRSRAEAAVMLAGPSKNSEVRAVINEMKGLGAQSIFVDGAFDRQSAADPMIADQVILASGAALSSDVATLVELTKCRVEQLMLPACGDEYRELAQRNRNSIVRLIDGRMEEIESCTALLENREWSHILLGCEALFIKGALGEGLGQALLHRKNLPKVIIQNGSKIFLSPETWRSLRQKSVLIEAEQRIHLLGVTVNPVCPGGIGMDPDALITAMGRALHPLPVLDAVRELKYVRQECCGTEVSGC